VKSDAGSAATVEAPEGTEAHPDKSEEDEGKDAAEAEAGDKEVSAPDWATSDLQGLAGSYGLSVEDLAEMSGPDEFLRHARRMDRGLRAETKPVASPAEKTPDKKPPTQAEVAELNAEAFANYEPEVQAFVRSHAALQQEHRAALERMDRLEGAVAEYFAGAQKAQEEARLVAFHKEVDQLDPETFGCAYVEGKKGAQPLSEAADAARRKFHADALALLPAIARQNGGQMPDLDVALRRVYQIQFADQIRARERRVYEEKVAAQSKRRRAAPGRPKPAADPDAEEQSPAQKVANHPEVVKAWNKASGET
jgi:hypothetical protein